MQWAGSWGPVVPTLCDDSAVIAGLCLWNRACRPGGRTARSAMNTCFLLCTLPATLPHPHSVSPCQSLWSRRIQDSVITQTPASCRRTELTSTVNPPIINLEGWFTWSLYISSCPSLLKRWGYNGARPLRTHLEDVVRLCVSHFLSETEPLKEARFSLPELARKEM